MPLLYFERHKDVLRILLRQLVGNLPDLPSLQQDSKGLLWTIKKLQI